MDTESIVKAFLNNSLLVNLDVVRKIRELGDAQVITHLISANKESVVINLYDLYTNSYFKNKYLTDSEKAILRRYIQLRERSKKYNVEIISPKDFFTFVQYSIENYFSCHYCKKPLKIKSKTKYYLDSLSIDHKIPITRGGKSTFENLCVCCHLCNIIKGTMTEKEFIETYFIKMTPNERDQLFINIFKGQLAKKIERS
jgi:5-methylcytosine-specific restriction endonuclease McrA